MPADLYAALAGMAFVHVRHLLSASAGHALRYCPMGHGNRLHSEQAPPLLKNPLEQDHAQLFALAGCPGVEYAENDGLLLVHGTHVLSAVARQVERYCPVGQL
jgi:hypothetical protein